MKTSDSRNESLTALAGRIAHVIQQARSHVRQSVNQAMVASYWEIGQLIVEHEQQGQARAAYGQRQMAELSAQLTVQFGKGFDASNLRNMRRFYLAFPIRDAVRLELGWTHYRSLLRIENPAAREWYLREAISQNWSSRALERQISVLYYERLLSSKEKALVEAESKEKTAPLAETAKDFLRDPYVLDFLNLQDQSYQESTLEQGLINNLQQFLLELGKGFAFVARQQRVRFEDEDFYIDLVFYNFRLKCFLLIDLKLSTLRHQDVGQMDTHVRLYDEQIKGADDNPTIGLLLCSEKSEAELKQELERERERALQSLAQQQELKE